MRFHGLLSAVTVLTPPLCAQSLNIDIESDASTYGSPPSSYGAAASQPGHWHTITAAPGVLIRDLAGALTPVEIDFPFIAFWDADTSQGAAGDAGALINDAANPGPYVSTVTFQNLVPGNYEVYTYCASSWLSGQDVTIGGVTEFAWGFFSGTHVEGNDYTHHQATVDASGTLDIGLEVFKFHDYATLNGFQLVRIGQVGTQFCAGDGTGPLPCPCGNDSPTPSEGCLSSAGTGMRLWATGSGSLALDDTVLTADRCPPNNTGIFYVGQGNIWPGQHLYDGIQCAVGPALRYPGQLQTNGVATEGGLVAQDPSGAFFVPGTTYLFQYFTRDNQTGSSPCGGFANLSPTLRVVFSP